MDPNRKQRRPREGKLRGQARIGPRGEPGDRFRTRIPSFGHEELLPALARQAVRIRVAEGRASGRVASIAT